MWRQGRELITRSSSLYRSLQTWQMSLRSSSSLFSSTGGAESQKLIIFLISVTITFLNLYEILLFSSFCLHESRLLRLCNSHSIVEFAFSIRLEFCERVLNIINIIKEVKDASIFEHTQDWLLASTITARIRPKNVKVQKRTTEGYHQKLVL